ncbi:hypothetical protein EV424DRAFT_1349514 [Suillus variegatus]|nr:hypothetical protein EV424DRAFT_1349514 [Suillus variegatus]
MYQPVNSNFEKEEAQYLFWLCSCQKIQKKNTTIQLHTASVIHVKMPLQLNAPALNPDGSLKNTKEMEWFHSPTSKPTPGPLTLTIPARNRPSSPTPQLKFISSTPADFINSRKQKANNSAPSDPTPTASTHPKGQAGTNAKSKMTTTVTKSLAIACVKQNGLHCMESSSELVKKKRKRGDGGVDILMIFKLVDDDPSEGYVCFMMPIKKSMANYKLSSKATTMLCVLTSNVWEELDRLEGKATNMQHSILDFAETMKPIMRPEYTKDGL